VIGPSQGFPPSLADEDRVSFAVMRIDQFGVVATVIACDDMNIGHGFSRDLRLARENYK
jgi:hypothetical protein